MLLLYSVRHGAPRSSFYAWLCDFNLLIKNTVYVCTFKYKMYLIHYVSSFYFKSKSTEKQNNKQLRFAHSVMLWLTLSPDRKNAVGLIPSQAAHYMCHCMFAFSRLNHSRDNGASFALASPRSNILCQTARPSGQASKKQKYDFLDL